MSKQKLFRLTPPTIRESDVARACCAVLYYRGYFPVRIPTGLYETVDGRKVKVGDVGIPDYVAIHERHPGFFLEVKRPGGHLRPEQRSKIGQLRAGYRLAVAVVDSAQALVEWLDAHERISIQEVKQC